MKYSFTILLSVLISTVTFAAKDEVPYWIRYPEAEDSLVTDYYFKTEVKLKDSVEFAELRIAGTGLIQVWINNFFVIVNGQPSPSIDEPKVSLTNVSRYMKEGDNAIAVCLRPDSPNDQNNNTFAMALTVNNEAGIFSNKNFSSYRQKVNNYTSETIGGNIYLIFNFDARNNIVGNWQKAGFEAKRFSPEKWQKPEEVAVFKIDTMANTYIPSTVTSHTNVKNIAFPKNIKPGDIVEADLPEDKKVIVEIGVESVKDRTFYIYTPEMDRTGIKHSYKTTFGGQSFFMPELIKADKLMLEFEDPMKLVGITYRILNE